jgi:MarR family transcriptional regulator, lower aerobic nicotinate degradation pathway regulator
MTNVRSKANGIESLDRLYRRTGFLLRRAHQIAEGIFLRECADLGLTAPQCGCLIVAHSRPGLDQKEIGVALGFDRATTGQILKGLEARGLIVRTTSDDDGRKRCIAVTSRGTNLLKRAGGGLERSHERLLQVFSAEERKVFTSLLNRLCATYNEEARAVLARPRGTVAGIQP